MCTRFSQTTQIIAAARQRAFRDPKNHLSDWKPLYNIAPTDEALVAASKPDGVEFEKMVFGLVPHWAKDVKMGLNCLNARSETITEKPSFREPLKNRRCVVLTEGYYDWKREGKKKTPFRIFLKTREPFALAGLWDEWISPQGRILHSFSIVTAAANPLLDPINDRMPVILNRNQEELWLDAKKTNPAELTPLLKSYSGDEMGFYQVSPKMSLSSYKEADCMEEDRTLKLG